MNKYYGKFRGKVTNNIDDSKQGMIEVTVASVRESEPFLALPCAPFAGSNVGLFVVPPVNANVWVEFEEGNLMKPIWSGGFWDRGEAPAILTPGEDSKVIIKTKSATITLSEASGEDNITFETSDGFKIVLGSAGIEITNGNGKISLEGQNVIVNDGSLEVS